MLKKLWGRIRGWFSTDSATTQLMYKELALNEYKSIVYTLRRADTLEKLLDTRKRIRKFQQLLIEGHLEYWGRVYIIDLNKLWNAKYKYWKNRARNN